MPADPRTIEELAHAIAAGQTTSESVTRACLERIAARDTSINAFITVLADQALEQAREADREIAAGRLRGPLHGVPISIKDILDVRGAPTTAASRVRATTPVATDALVVQRLRDAGAVFVGKTNLHEFALGTTNEDSAFGPVRHPLDASRSPGGSSGGSAASVLDGMAWASIGTDTGGSVRIPAAACGLVGLKPALDDLPRNGVVPLSTTMDHVGSLSRSVEDARLLFQVMRGEPTTPAPERRDVRGLRLGVPRAYFLAMLDPQVASTFERVCADLVARGVVLEDVTIEHADDIAPIYLHIGLSEAAALHAKTLDSRGQDYTAPVRSRLEMGRYILAEDYVRALRGREVLRAEVDGVLAGRDGLLLPSMPVPATKIGVPMVRVGTTEEPVRNITLRLTQLFNVTGHPAVTIPCGTTIEGLPIGAQLVGPQQSTLGLLALAASLEPHMGPGGAG